MKKAISVLLAALMLTALICAPASAFQAKIFSDSSVIYEYPVAGARSVSGYGGVLVEVTDWRSGWAKIYRAGITAYIPIKDLNLATPIPGWTNCAATVYNAYGRAAGTAPYGTMVYVIGYYDGYCRVVNSSGTLGGYIHMSNLSRSAPAPTPVQEQQSSASSYTTGDYTGNAKMDYLLYIAYSNLNKPYEMPSNAPYTFDCSSFVRYCYAALGYDVGRTAQAQGYNDSLAKIGYSDIRPGDILCFNTETDDNDLSDHTAIYLGGGKFVHASSTAGKVQVNTFTDYYRERFSWARRVL